MKKRLIDADALFGEIEEMETIGTMDNENDAAVSQSKVLDIVFAAPTIDAVPVDFINQKIVELQSCANQHFDDGHEILATCVWETIRLLGSFLKE